jgi:hypothetical protein
MVQKCASTTVMKDNAKITAGRKEMYHWEENVTNMALVCSSCTIALTHYFLGSLCLWLSDQPCFLGRGGGGVQYCRKSYLEDTQLSSLCTPTWPQSSHFSIIHILTLANPEINLSAVLSCSGKVWYAAVVGIFGSHCKIPTLLILSLQNRL